MPSPVCAVWPLKTGVRDHWKAADQSRHAVSNRQSCDSLHEAGSLPGTHDDFLDGRLPEVEEETSGALRAVEMTNLVLSQTHRV